MADREVIYLLVSDTVRLRRGTVVNCSDKVGLHSEYHGYLCS